MILKKFKIYFSLVCLLLVSGLGSAQSSTSEADNSEAINKRLYYSAMIGFMPGSQDDDFENSGLRGLNIINFMIGHRFNQYAHLGAGLALDIYDMGLYSFRLDFRGFILKEKSVNPYYSLQTGYGFAFDLNNRWDDRLELKGGPLIHPAIGLMFNTHKAGDILVEAGYLFQKAARNDPDRRRFDDILYQRLNIRLGLIF